MRVPIPIVPALRYDMGHEPEAGAAFSMVKPAIGIATHNTASWRFSPMTVLLSSLIFEGLSMVSVHPLACRIKANGLGPQF